MWAPTAEGCFSFCTIKTRLRRESDLPNLHGEHRDAWMQQVEHTSFCFDPKWKEDIDFIGSGAVTQTLFQKDFKRALLHALLNSWARAAFWIHAEINMAGKKVEVLNKTSLAFCASQLPCRTTLENLSKGSPASCRLWVVTRAPERCWFTMIFPGCHVMMMGEKSSFQCFHLEGNFPFSSNVIEYTLQVYFSRLCWVMISVISMITLVMCSEISRVCFLMYLQHQDDGYMLHPKYQIA